MLVELIDIQTWQTVLEYRSRDIGDAEIWSVMLQTGLLLTYLHTMVYA